MKSIDDNSQDNVINRPNSYDKAFDIACEIARLESLKNEYEMKNPRNIHEIEIKHRNIEAYNKQIQALNDQLRAFPQEGGESFEKYIADRRSKGIPDHEIAWNLQCQFDLPKHKIGELLSGSQAGYNTNWKRGDRLLKKYKKK